MWPIDRLDVPAFGAGSSNDRDGRPFVEATVTPVAVDCFTDIDFRSLQCRLDVDRGSASTHRLPERDISEIDVAKVGPPAAVVDVVDPATHVVDIVAVGTIAVAGDDKDRVGATVPVVVVAVSVGTEVVVGRAAQDRGGGFISATVRSRHWSLGRPHGFGVGAPARLLPSEFPCESILYCVRYPLNIFHLVDRTEVS